MINENVEKTTIIASFTYNIFHSETNGFCVSTFKEKKGKLVKCVGNNLPLFKNVDYELTGTWGEDKKGDKQFNVESFTEHVEKTRESIIAFLSSGAIKGIGKKTAERIYDMYGENSLETIEKMPENLLRIRGITQSKLDTIIESYSKNHLPKELIELLLPCGFSTKLVLKVNQLYRQNAISTIEADPYELCKIHGVSFAMADRVGNRFKIPIDDKRRLHAAIYEALKDNYFSGKVGATLNELIKRVTDYTNILDPMAIREMIIKMARNNLISYRKLSVDGNTLTFFYSNEVKQMEESLSKLIISNIGKNDKSKVASDIIENSKEIVFDESQKQAIINAFTYRLSIVTGGPGTGKTTITKKIAEINNRLYKKDPIYLAPTGKAARRITESTGIEASTIHSYLNLRPSGDEENSFDETEHVVIKESCVIIDEFSMVDMALAKLLFERLMNCRVIIVGDPDQLQSVGAGNVLLDMINSGKIPVSKLIYEHRQGEGSTIKKNANGMQNGMTTFETADDFKCEFVGREESLKKIEDKMVDEYLRYYNDPSFENVVCLCPYKNYQAGMYSVNKRLQDVINPAYPGVTEYKGAHEQVFRVGDPVMHIERNTEDVSNGNTGIVKGIGKVDGELTLFAEFDLGNRVTVVEYNSTNISQLSLAYATTVHKSQGSEYDAVVTCLSSFHRMMIKRRIPYTAITRAKKSVSVFMDSEETLKSAINNDCTEDRNTLLCHLLKESSKPSFNIPKKKEIKTDGIKGQISLGFT